MLIQEEIRFNEAKEQFDQALKSLEDAINFYQDASFYQRRDSGITQTSFTELVRLRDYIRVVMPKRDLVIENIAITVDEISDINTGNIEAGGLVAQNERTNFFTTLTEFIRSTLDRILGRNVERNNQPNIEDDEKISEESETIETDEIYYGDEPRTFDVPAIIQAVNSSREELVSRSQALDSVYERDFERQPEGKVIGTQRGAPGILDTYREDSWGVKRICLDGFQNHLPADAKGTKCYLHFLIGNKWVPQEIARLNKDKIRAVRFADNGVGFTPDNLLYLHSTKRSEDASAGQFGEGMKLASMAAVKLGLGLEFQSRNWIATASGEKTVITNTRNADEKDLRTKLVYDVKIYDGEPIRRIKNNISNTYSRIY